ncbi:MAG: ATP-binding cassette domain-containing protein [Mariniblastus sp.]|nr:ATP-binding cassette domain-containing protein [Mariniblastus sp.]
MEAGLAPGVELVGVSKRFDDSIDVVDRVDLTIPAGKFVVLLGPTGCGKTTILRMVGGLECPDEGEIRFTQSAPRTAFCFQEPRLLPWRNVRRNVGLPLELARHHELDEVVNDVLELVELTDAAERMPAALSGGMKMRTSLARALVSSPDLLLLDEPFGALDEVTRFRLDEDVARLVRGRDTTSLMVTHSISEAVFLADEVIVLSPRPAQVVERFQVDFGERLPQWRATPEFARLTSQVYEALRAGMGEPV